MGWADCGVDSKGRPIGYAHAGVCDAPGCRALIHRGLALACGGMHGVGELSCEGYFCERHRGDVIEHDGQCIALCDRCYEAACEAARRHPDEFPELAAELDEELPDPPLTQRGFGG